MANVIPLPGVRYNPNIVPDLSLVTTPPYDLIDLKRQEYFYQLHPYNIIRLELPKTLPGDDKLNNRYTRAAATYREWLDNKILQKDRRPAIYIYRQSFKSESQTKHRTGFIARIRLEDYASGIILPHEETLPKHKEDRFKMLEACHTNFSSIFGLYADRERSVDVLLQDYMSGTQAIAEFTDADHVTHAMWKIEDNKVLTAITQAMRDKNIYIADGHHRYETALKYCKHARNLGWQGTYDYVMMTLVNLYHEGLVVFPTHRLVKNLPDFCLNDLLDKLSRHFEVNEFTLYDGQIDPLINALREKGKLRPTFGLYGGGNKYYTVTLAAELKTNTLMPQDKSPAWRRLDVSVLHHLILEPLLGIGQAQRESETNLTYTRDAAKAVISVAKGEHQLVFLMNATPVEQVIEVATAGDKMPQKSTFFYPKLITGLVINDLRE